MEEISEIDSRLLSQKKQEVQKIGFLLFGGQGWIGGLLAEILQEQGESFAFSKARLENRQDILRDLLYYSPDYVINTAGKTGRPNVDWCEDHKEETLRSNVLGLVNLVDLCFLRGLGVTNFGSGCIYSSIGEEEFSEEDPPNFTGSFYSFTKLQAEKLLSVYPNVLTLRLRMPIDARMNPRSFIYKITRYEKICSLPNSMSVLEDLLPLAIDMTKKSCRGLYNFTNPGSITHNQILSLYKELVDPQFTWKNFTLEEQSQVIKAPRSNCLLKTDKLQALYPDLPDIHQAVRKALKDYAEKKNSVQ